ncbi:MAG: insulinase family protein [Bacilli bacterium]|nr:insulinase family protein [Bacilli bacterium]
MSNIETIKLDNGLTIYLYSDKRRHSTLFQHITLFGGKTKDFIFEGKEYHIQDGVAHILEHYVVEENSRGNFLKLLGEKQMATNASTYYGMTRYYFEAVENVEYGIETMIRGIYAPVFSEERLEKIKKPILQEIKGRMGNKFYHSNQMTLNNCFKNIKVRSIGGTLEEVENTTLDDIVTCYKAFYQPSNQFIVVAGSFDKESVLKTINDIYNDLDLNSYDMSLIPSNEDNSVQKDFDTLEFPTGEEYMEVTYKISLKDFNEKERLKIDFYLHYFFDMYFGMTSNLYRDLVKDKIITTTLSCSNFMIDDFVLVSVGSYSDNISELEKRIKDTCLKLNDFNEEIFEIDKRDSILKIVLRNENLVDTIMPFVSNIVEFNYPYPDTVNDIENFTYDDFVKTIKSLDFSNYTVTNIKNKKA